MFGFRRRETPAIQLYGKLPLAKDYLRLGFGTGGGLALRDWLDATFSGAAGGEPAPELAWPARFLAGDAWGTCLQGILGPSSDSGGLRSFPFALCVERRRRAVIDDLPQLLAEAGAVWTELGRRRERCAAHPDGRSLLRVERGSQLDLGGLASAPPSGVDVGQWLEALWPGGGREGFEVDLERLARVAADRTAGPIRLPLAAGCSQRQQVVAWLEALGRLGVVDPRGCPTLFFPDGPGSAVAADAPAPHFLTVFRSAPRPADGRWLAAPNGGGPLGPGDLVAGRPAAVAEPPVGGPGLPPLSASLRSVLTGFVRRPGESSA